MPTLALASETLGHSDLHLSNDSHFAFFLYLRLLRKLLNLEPSFLAVIHLRQGYPHRMNYACGQYS